MEISEQDQEREDQTPPFSFTNLIAKFFLWVILLAAGGLALWTWITLKFVYSSGERAGYVQKISKKGWLFKTWEGELAMVNLPGTMPEKFYFSVQDDSTATEIQKTLGQRVILSYEEHRGIPLPVFGDTDYFATQIHLQKEGGSGTPGSSTR